MEKGMKFPRNFTENRFWTTDFWSKINLSDVARAALHSSAYFTSLLNAELWWEKEFGQVNFWRENLIISYLQEKDKNLKRSILLKS